MSNAPPSSFTVPYQQKPKVSNNGVCLVQENQSLGVPIEKSFPFMEASLTSSYGEVGRHSTCERSS